MAGIYSDCSTCEINGSPKYTCLMFGVRILEFMSYNYVLRQFNGSLYHVDNLIQDASVIDKQMGGYVTTA